MAKQKALSSGSANGVAAFLDRVLRARSFSDVETDALAGNQKFLEYLEKLFNLTTKADDKKSDEVKAYKRISKVIENAAVVARKTVPAEEMTIALWSAYFEQKKELSQESHQSLAASHSHEMWSDKVKPQTLPHPKGRY